MQFKKSGIAAVFLLVAVVSIFIFGSSPGPALETAVAGDVTPDVLNYLPLVIKPAEPTATTTSTKPFGLCVH